jgi:hypothetical protein
VSVINGLAREHRISARSVILVRCGSHRREIIVASLGFIKMAGSCSCFRHGRIPSPRSGVP